jgi:hypothetical protein
MRIQNLSTLERKEKLLDFLNEQRRMPGKDDSQERQLKQSGQVSSEAGLHQQLLPPLLSSKGIMTAA